MRRGWLMVLAAVTVTAGAIALVAQRGGRLVDPPAATNRQVATAPRPELAVLTSLPLLFGETLTLELRGSPALTRLETAYRVEPIAVADAASLKGKRLLLMAHPRAQPAEVLVELDDWVRRGGRVLLLADPKLDWHSERPLGDALRPPPDFADSGLLAHWGLRLDGPVIDGPQVARVDDQDVLTASPGMLMASARQCQVEAGGLVAKCSIGRGAVTVIADADFLNVDGEGALDGPTEHNLDLLITQLRVLESR